MPADESPETTPTGLPDDEEPSEPAPLGSPGGEDDEPGGETMPGIVTDGDPPDAG